MQDGYQVAVLGTKAEAGVIARVVKACPGIVDLSGRTSLYDIAELARHASGAVGNDTGPPHLAALAGCPAVALFCNAASNPACSAPLGKSVRIIQADDLGDVTVNAVYNSLQPRAAP